jgi:Flp pilus assembly protein TadG
VKISRVVGNIEGQTLIEFALIVTLLLALLFGITEFGRGWYYSNALTNGARAGARYASELPKDANYETRIQSYTFAQITSSIPRNNLVLVNISAFAPDGSARTGTLGTGTPSYPEHRDAVEVIVHYNFVVLTGSIIPVFQGTKRMIRSATMYYEGS